jgi:hypothetical protein
MTGIDVFSAMLIATEIVDVKRFCTPWKLVSYAGLAPSTREFPVFKSLLDNAFPSQTGSSVPGPNYDDPWPLPLNGTPFPQPGQNEVRGV